jgi:PAS domain S-box-containing protein
MYQLFGFEKNIKPGPESLCSVVNESDFPVFLKSVKNAFLTGYEHHVEYRIKRPSDGEVRWIDCRGKIVLDKEGKPEKVSGFVQDITERKTNELNLINNEKKYRRLFEMSEDPMWMILDNKFVLANQAAAKTLAYETVDEIINIPPWQVSPEYQPDGGGIQR